MTSHAETVVGGAVMGSGADNATQRNFRIVIPESAKLLSGTRAIWVPALRCAAAGMTIGDFVRSDTESGLKPSVFHGGP